MPIISSSFVAANRDLDGFAVTQGGGSWSLVAGTGFVIESNVVHQLAFGSVVKAQMSTVIPSGDFRLIMPMRRVKTSGGQSGFTFGGTSGQPGAYWADINTDGGYCGILNLSGLAPIIPNASFGAWSTGTIRNLIVEVRNPGTNSQNLKLMIDSSVLGTLDDHTFNGLGLLGIASYQDTDTAFDFVGPFTLESISPPVVIAPNDPRIKYEGRWDVNETRAISINSGQSFRFAYTKDLCSLGFNTAGLTAYPIIATEADTVKSRTVLSNSVNSIALSPEYNSGTTPSVSIHQARAIIDGITETGTTNWTTQDGRIEFTGLTLAPGADLVDIPDRPYIEIDAGDSIAQGCFLIGTGANVAANMRSSINWPVLVAEELGYGASVVATGGTGLFNVGNGGMPKASLTFPYIYSGKAWSPAQDPIAVIIPTGTNDVAVNGATYQAAYLALLQQVRTKYPDTVIFCVTLKSAAALMTFQRSAVQAMNDDNIIHFDYTASNSPYADAQTQDTVHLKPDGALLLKDAIVSDIRDSGKLSGGSGSSPAGVYPDEDETLTGVVFGPNSEFTGNVIVPLASVVKLDEEYGPNGEMIGTYAPSGGGGSDADAIKAACIEALQETRVKLDFSDTQVIPNVATNTLAGALNGSLLTALGSVIWNKTTDVISIFRKGSGSATATFDASDPDQRIAQ